MISIEQQKDIHEKTKEELPYELIYNAIMKYARKNPHISGNKVIRELEENSNKVDDKLTEWDKLEEQINKKIEEYSNENKSLEEDISKLNKKLSKELS